jgi:hypothetical protein
MLRAIRIGIDKNSFVVGKENAFNVHSLDGLDFRSIVAAVAAFGFPHHQNQN